MAEQLSAFNVVVFCCCEGVKHGRRGAVSDAWRFNDGTKLVEECKRRCSAMCVL